jgi:hypothetical protein
MTDTETLLTELNDAKTKVLYAYGDYPDDESHLRYQALHELVSAFEEMLDAAPEAHSLADQVHIPLALLESWIHAIARNRLYPRDRSFIEAENAIKAAAIATLTPEEIAEATRRPRTPRLYGDELTLNDAVLPFLGEPAQDTLNALNDWIKAVGKSAVWEKQQQDNPPLIAQRRS